MKRVALQSVECYSLTSRRGLQAAVSALVDGQILLLRLGIMYGLVVNPRIAGLSEKLNALKGRESGQHLSLICTRQQASGIVDWTRAHTDLRFATPDLCSKAIIRIPLDLSVEFSFPYNREQRSIQFLSLEQAGPHLRTFQRELSAAGCPYLLATSGNVHGGRAVKTPADARRLAAMLNTKADFLGFPGVRTAIADMPRDETAYNGSFPILSFCDPAVVEVKRLIAHADRTATEALVSDMLSRLPMVGPVRFDC
jgi:hypothetical protein